MTTAIFEIEKEEAQLKNYTLCDIPITKEGVEEAIFGITGLRPEQYDVSYLDSENDKIMAAVQDDYAIAELTIEDDIIVFQVEVKADVEDIQFLNKDQEKEENQEKEDEEEENDDEENQENEAVQESDSVYESGCFSEGQVQKSESKKPDDSQSKNLVGSVQCRPKQISVASKCYMESQIESERYRVSVASQSCELEKEETQQEKALPLKFDAVNQTESSQPDTFNLAIQTVPEPQPQRQVEVESEIKQDQLGNFEQLAKTEQLSNILQNQELVDKLFALFTQRLPTILTSSCFKTNQSNPKVQRQEQEHKNQCSTVKSCILCKTKIKTIPFYFNQYNEVICLQCEDSYDENQLLVKIRSQQHFSSLLTVKMIPILHSQVAEPEVEEY